MRRDQFLGWACWAKYSHAIGKGVGAACGVKLPPSIDITKERRAGGCARCMAWARKNRVP